ncbi:MAG: hypothetical protein ACK4EX_08185 [Thermaurantimonas sp.]|uniref:hypothetical protein n=1 Tax=Thermaurantimonas sp. TaxID=2681568 RepID=UPI00391A9A14
MKKQLLILTIFGSILLGCNKDPVSNNPTGPVDIHEMVVNSTFEWDAAKTYQLDIIGYANSVLLIKDSDGNVIHKAMLTKDESYKTTIQLPAHHKTIRAEFLDNVYEINLDQSTIHFTLN